MKTIEQRAEEYAPNTITSHIFKSSPLKGLIVRILRDAYIAGANEQKEIDDALLLKLKSSWEEEAQINHNDESNYKQGYHDAVERACSWLKQELQYLAMDEVKDNFYKNEFKVILKSQVPDWLRDFRKAMEE